MSTADRAFRWRSVAGAVFLPNLVFSIGQYAVIPVIPALAQRLGTDLRGAALIASMLVVGQLIGDIPSGAIIARIGERTAMIAAAGLAMIGAVAAVFAPHAIMLGAAMLVIGVAGAAFGLARHAFMTSFVPLRFRARALSALGGSDRLGAVIGPFAGAGLLTLTGAPHSVLWLLGALCLIAGLLLVVLRDPDEVLGVPRGSRAGQTEVRTEANSLWATLASSRRVLLTLGVGAAILSGLRQARQVVLPVWAASIGLDEASTSVILGVAGFVDFSLFFLGGWITDRFGRLWTILPCAIGISTGMIALALTHDLGAKQAWFVAIALFIALANGLGSGILMTLGADLADRRNPARFLGAWRFTNDAGGALLPIVVTTVAAIATLPIAVFVLGILGYGGAITLRIFVSRHVSLKPGQEPPA
ncbi:MAG: MFS transporter [Pseudolysinimonas sp.]|uniref:MFS transporter n=1 Tax=Pseudolysinimonas sp. TaxID=2680009 RepID=UPI0032649455